MKVVLFLFSLLLASPAFAQSVEDGYTAYDDGDYEKAKSIFHALAEKGNAKAMNAIGLLYSWGKAYPHNRKVACDWYEKAAHLGYSSAQNNFGLCFDDEGGRNKSAKNFIYWLTKAAEQSHIGAQLSLGTWYLKTNEEKAIYWTKKAAAQNSTTARVNLWLFDKEQDISPVSFLEITCVFTKVYLLKLGNHSCDN
ncbi:hypothetical protein GCM10011332_08570 [Terasakiella brassicae]|uniref:Sel1 repeat family protein n=1 Tax=Terasakiella brassicae TaxID=1634917 RepID=A0A917FAC9_9PROT|nr:tetratricopeptide repeat protein [Terasakiella brassicae]GGF57404.1 hypothetical protein GCM10011332_08570 [Terasakiella brassicae]